MAKFIEIFKKDANLQNEISQTIDKYDKESFSARSQISQDALIQSEVFKQVKNIMGETISDMHIELEQKDNKIHILEEKVGIPDSLIVEEMNRSDLNKVSREDKCDRIVNRLNKTLKNHENTKI